MTRILSARRCIPVKFRKLILSHYHDSMWAGAHMGVRKTYEKIKAKFYARNLHKYVQAWVKTCPACQVS